MCISENKGLTRRFIIISLLQPGLYVEQDQISGGIANQHIVAAIGDTNSLRKISKTKIYNRSECKNPTPDFYILF